MTTADSTQNPASEPEPSTVPGRAGWVLASLIAVATVANLGLAVANVALPDIGQHFDASQTDLNLVAIAYSLGLACSVLYFGAVGDRYGRKGILLVGMALTIPADLVAAFAPSIGVLFAARIVGGLAAGMAYPTTLALITALWSGPARTRSIALWAATGGALTALGPLLSGVLLQHFSWGSPFLLTLPFAGIALLMALKFIPANVNETTEPVDHPGGVLTIFLVGAFIVGINLVVVPGKGSVAIGLFAVAAAALIAFYIRERRAANPLYDLHIASRRTFWVAAVAGIIVFGSLMGTMYIGQQFLQNVLGYSTVGAGAAILPAAVCMVLVAPRSAKLVEARGAANDPAPRLRLRPARLPHHADPLEGGHLVLEGGPRLCLRRHRSRARRHPRLPLAHRFRAGETSRDGIRDSRSSARPGWRDPAVDHGGLPDRRLRRRCVGGNRRVRQERVGQRPERADEIVLECVRRGQAVPAVDPERHSRRREGLLPPWRPEPPTWLG